MHSGHRIEQAARYVQAETRRSEHTHEAVAAHSSGARAASGSSDYEGRAGVRACPLPVPLTINFCQVLLQPWRLANLVFSA